jgi:hypothetical protein
MESGLPLPRVDIGTEIMNHCHVMWKKQKKGRRERNRNRKKEGLGKDAEQKG